MKKQSQAGPLEEHVPKLRWKILLVLIAGMILFLVILFNGINQVSPAKAQGPEPTRQGVSVGEPVTPGLSPPVRSLPTTQPRKAGVPAPEVNPRQPGGYVPDNTEGSLPERAPLPQVSAAISAKTPAFSLSFDGIDLQTGGAGIPPDTVGDVGPNHYVQMVNSSFSIYNKSGVKLTGPTDINAIWPGTDTTKCKTQNDGDPIVLYDRAADRWLMTQFGVTGGAPFYQCIAISQTADPTGSWFTYSFQVIDSGSNFNDYGKFGVWPDGYYMGANENGFTAYVFDRATMLTGAAATFQKIASPNNMMLPSDLDGPTAPPANSPNYFYTMKTGDIIELWAFSVDWVTPGNSTFTKVQDLISAGFIFDVCPANPTSDSFSFDCIPQPGTAQTLDAIGEWPMFRFQYRNHGSHESLVGNFTVDMNAATADQAGIHWFELRKVGAGNWTIHDEGNQAPDAAHRWMGSAAMDKDGNIAVGYSVSDGTSIFPSIRYATRLATDPAGTLGAEVTLHAGAASQTGSNRWGDYSAMSVDPVDDCTFWYTNEYIQNSANGWRTRIGSFKIPSCGATAALSITKTASSTSIEAGQALTYTVTVTSTGAVTTTDILITDTVPTSTTLNAASLSGDATNSGTAAGSVITWTTGVSLTQNQTLSRTFVVMVSTTITNGDQIVNTAYVSATNISDVQSSTVTNTAGGGNLYLPIILKNN